VLAERFRVASSGEQVAADLRRSLLRGELAPGTRLEEMKLAATFGVSRNTVREALQLLAGENLVQRTLHRSVIVREVGDPKDVIDLYRARATVEVAAVPAAAAQQMVWFDHLARALEAIASATNRDELDEADLHFHAAIVSAIGSQRISRFYERIHTELRLTRGWALRAPVNSQEVADSHAPLFQALKAGDAATSLGVLEKILKIGETGLLDAIARSSATNAPSAGPT
jgi:DNA-binding GntR family transcriptional regulator